METDLLETCASRIPTTITSLPIEILQLITFHLDLPSALSFAQTCQYLRPSVEARLYRDLAVIVPNLERLVGKGGAELAREADVHKAAIKARLLQILSGGDERRWRMVKTVRLCPRPGSAHGMVHLLDCVSAGLRELKVEFPAYICDDWRNSDHDTLDLCLITAGLAFPSLTHLTLGKETLRFAESITILCNAAPSLVFLDVDIDHDLTSEWSDPCLPPFPKDQTPTQLRELRLAFGESEGLYTGGIPSYSPILSLLQESPLIRTLVLKPSLSEEAASKIMVAIISIIAPLEHLRDLYFGTTARHFQSYRCDPERYFLSLRRVVFGVDGSSAVDLYMNMPRCPQLEIVIFHNSRRQPPSALSPSSQNLLVGQPRAMISMMGGRLIASPRLGIIAHLSRSQLNQDGEDLFAQLDHLEANGLLKGSVCSYRFEGYEMVHARLLLDFTEYDVDASRARGSDGVRIMSYSSSVGITERYKALEPVSKLIWVDYTSFYGKVVPLEVIEQMRGIEGATTKDWERRCVEVGKASYQFLTGALGLAED